MIQRLSHLQRKAQRPNVAVTGIALNKTTLSLEVAAKETLVATVEPAEATDKTVTWSSADTGIATVSNTGEVTGVATGTTDVTVTTTEGNKMATCAVTITAGV